MGDEEIIDLDALVPGIYIIKACGAGNTQTLKTVIR